MNILVLTKRYTSAKDISREGVGRPFLLFDALRRLGHGVTFLLGDYTERERRDEERDGVRFLIRPLDIPRLIPFRRAVVRELARGAHDLLVAEGDPAFAILALGPCARAGVPLVYDLMDNYETYDIYRLPLVRPLDRRSIRAAALVVCVTRALAEKVRPARGGPVAVVGNGVDADRFRPMDREACRRSLSLPPRAPVVGYFGNITGYKGSGVLREAHRLLRREAPGAVLLLAGPAGEGAPRGEGVVHLGLVPHADIPALINACDAVAVPNPSNAYTDYSFPLKVLEGLACGVPVVATALGPVREILGDGYPWLARPSDPADLAAKLLAACAGRREGLREIALAHTWRHAAGELGRALAPLAGTG
ncbi:MAG: glycosyltransferase family 4 protein [bacterium]|nr:glycosyltransferase family 4 protein [bacterium]